MKKFVWIAIFVVAIGTFTFGINTVGQRASQEGAETLQKAISRACVECYALEGRYPSSVEYLEKNYGIQIDDEKYAVFYEGFATNVMPDITVSIK